jgi:hypothetical protein
MYLYYYLSPLYEQIRFLQIQGKSSEEAAKIPQGPWWKVCITQMQIVQFIIMNLQAYYLLNNKCKFPSRITTAYFFYIVSLLVLFLNFYVQTYCCGRRKSKKPVTAQKEKNL